MSTFTIQLTMFPPVDDAVFQNNPEFATLYNTLTTAILNPNGSTKNDPSAKDREVVREVCMSFLVSPKHGSQRFTL